MIEQLPAGVFQIVLRHLPALADQKSVALTSKRLSQWAYTCQMWCVTKPKELAAKEKEAKTTAQKVALIKEKSSTKREIENQSTLLGRTFFGKAVNNYVEAIAKGFVGANLKVDAFTLLDAVKPGNPKILEQIEGEITSIKYRKGFVEAHQQGKMKEYIESNKEGMIRGYKLEQFMSAKEVKSIDEMPNPNDEALLEYALNKAMTLSKTTQLTDALTRLEKARAYLAPVTNLPLQAPASPLASLSNSPGTPRKG